MCAYVNVCNFFKLRAFHMVGKSSTTELHTQEMTINQNSLLSGCFTHFAIICRPVGLSLPNANPLLQSPVLWGLAATKSSHCYFITVTLQLL